MRLDQKQQLIDAITADQVRRGHANASDRNGEGVANPRATWTRAFAFGIDVGIYAISVWIWSLVLTTLLGFDPTGESEKWSPTAVLFTVMISGWILFVVIVEILTIVRFNRTLGKAIMGLAVANAHSESRFLSLRQVATRTLTKTLIFYGIGFLFPWLLERLVLPGVSLWSMLALNVVLITLLLGIHRKDRRGLHDLVAKTKVIGP